MRSNPKAPGGVAAAICLLVLAAARAPAADPPTADALLRDVMGHLALGPPLEAKLLQRVRIEDQRLLGVGRYLQAGRGSGRCRMELRLPIAGGSSLLIQTNDGQLAWSQDQVGPTPRIYRVDVGRLAELAGPQSADGELPPRLRIGGLVELLDTIRRDYVLQLSRGSLDGEPVWIVRGTLGVEASERLREAWPKQRVPDFVPTQIRVAVTRFELGEGERAHLFPRMVEYMRSGEDDEGPVVLSTLEVRDYRLVPNLSREAFRFDDRRLEVEFSDRTEQYLRRFGGELAAAPRLPEVGTRR